MVLIRFIVLLLSTAVLLVSCQNKEKVKSSTVYELEYKIPVYEQESVSHYKVQVSTDGTFFQTADTLKASTAQEDFYQGSVEVTSFANISSILWIRIMSVDIDKKFAYSPVYRVKVEE